jgi:predicted nucleotidyltransferase
MRNEQTIRKLKTCLQDHLGKALDRVIVFGSVARGSAKDTSDIDVMIILEDELIDVNWRTEQDVMTVAYPIELEDDVVFDLKVMKKSDLQGIHGHTPFVENVMKEGIPV